MQSSFEYGRLHSPVLVSMVNGVHCCARDNVPCVVMGEWHGKHDTRQNYCRPLNTAVLIVCVACGERRSGDLDVILEQIWPQWPTKHFTLKHLHLYIPISCVRLMGYLHNVFHIFGDQAQPSMPISHWALLMYLLHPSVVCDE